MQTAGMNALAERAAREPQPPTTLRTSRGVTGWRLERPAIDGVHLLLAVEILESSAWA